MGYRSNIKLIVTFKPDKENFAEKMIQPLVDDQNLQDNLNGDEIKIDHCETYDKIIMSFDAWKWDESYEEVKSIEKWKKEIIDLFKTNKLQGGLHWVRIGEDYTDIEELWIGEPFESLHLIRKVKFDTELSYKSKTISQLFKTQ